ncbi:hypothetical protein GCM10009868_10870 [Terrabacter aerolatus]|uniref:Uncharacterized protein n=1 Tax=Terrabacter aerolatus TaxID=422442 RepID=A0A512D406_9MICO|nr:hypothetical protein [Terrabacter aerolatus]GEO31196.1 hypothetical protein TAE01_30060 [Terrabacter aerolatus]
MTFWSVRGAYLLVGPAAAAAVGGGVLALLVGLRGTAVLLEVHGLRIAGRPRPGAREILRLFVTMPSARLASTPEAPGLLYRWRGHLRREGAARRDLDHHRGSRVTVTVLYKDPEGDPVPEVPPFCRGSFTVEVEGQVITSNRSHPPVLGDPTTFWANLVADAAAGDLTVLRRDGDLCVVARVSHPSGTRFAVVVAESDWDLLRSAHPARPDASRAPGVTRGWVRSP